MAWVWFPILSLKAMLLQLTAQSFLFNTLLFFWWLASLVPPSLGALPLTPTPPLPQKAFRRLGNPKKLPMIVFC